MAHLYRRISNVSSHLARNGNYSKVWASGSSPGTLPLNGTFPDLDTDSLAGFRSVEGGGRMLLRTWSFGRLMLLLGIAALLLGAWVSMSLVLLFAILASIATLILAMCLASNGEARRAKRIFLGWGIAACFYLTALLVTAMWPHSVPVLKTGVPYCDDDWCMSFEGISKISTQAGASYRLNLRLFSLAHRTPQSARGAWVCLTDDQNHRYPPVDDPSVPPFDVQLDPGQSVATSLTFDLPADTKRLFFAGGMKSISYASFIIGNPDLLHKPRLELQIQ